PPRDPRGDRRWSARGRRQVPAGERFGRRHQGGDRAGVVAARRCAAVQGCGADLRRALFEETGGMYPELVTRGDLEVLLPPVGGQTVYVFGDPRDLANPDVTLTARVHDECNGSDVFGSDI